MSYMNEGTVDRVVRIALGILLLVLGFGGIVEGTLGTVFKFLGFVPLLTGLAGWCPIYAIGRLSTRTSAKKEMVNAR
ncbi:MAG: DUF2892 domain-containing protein [Acidimicrobiia bacterium]|nr:DUF2892 domain-containing protein [Acidimicrobiia bacterium]MDH5292925.1 DUF2892 domain-containing protein [Acidimicrobiia bacterium]